MDLQTTIKFVKGEGWDPQIVDPQGTNALTATTSDPLFWVCAVLLAVLAAGVAIYFITKRRAARNALVGAGSTSASMHYNALHARNAKPQREKSNLFKKALIVLGALLLASTLAFAVSSRDSIKALANDAGFSLFGNTATTTNTNAEGVTVPETILGYVSADGKVTIDNAPITNNNDDFIEFYKAQLSEMKGVGNSTWKFTIQKADGTKTVLFEGKVGDAAQSTWARLDKGEKGTLIVETDISPDLALQLIDNPTVKLGFNSMYHPVSLDITVSAGVKILDKDGNVLTMPIKIPSNEDFVFSIDDGQQGIATVVKVNGEVILPDEEGNYTIEKDTLAKDPKIEVTKYLFVLAKLNGGTIKEGSSAPSDWNVYSEEEGLYYKLYAAGPTAATIEVEWARDKVKVANEGNAFDGWNTNIPESGAVDNSYIEMKWAKSTKSFDPSEMTIDDNIIISDKDKLPYDEDDYPVPMKDGEDFTIHVNTNDPTKENDEIVVVISDESGSKEIVADPDGKVTIPDGDKDKEIKIKFKYVVTVDLNGASILPAGGNPPTGWTKSEATSSNQYTKKFLSGTSAEDIEAEWSLANNVHVKNGGQARDGWITDITEKGLQKSGEKCTMTWLSAEESSTINIEPDKDGHVVITDTDGNEYVAGDFPIAVKKGDYFEYKVKTKGETDDAKVKFVDAEGREVIPDDEGVFKIKGGESQAEIKTTITYPAIVDLSGGSINEEKLPDGWTKVTKANGDKYQKYFDKGTPAHRAAATDPAGVLDDWGTAIHKVKYEDNAFKAWVDNIPATGIAAKTTESITWAPSSHDFEPDAKDVDDGITISDKDKNPYDSEDYPIPMVDGEDFVIHVNPTDPEKTDEIVVVIGDDPGTEVTPGEDGKVTISDGDKDKEIKIKFKYVVTVDLNGASILPAGGNPPAGWTKSEATSSNQYTKKFLSGTSAEDIEDEWTLANNVHVKNGSQARDGWTTDITQKGLQKSGEKCTMTWFSAEESSTINIAPDKDGHVVITDTDGNEYVAGDFPIAVRKGDYFEYKVKTKGETDDAKVKFVDAEGIEVIPDDEGVFKIKGGESQAEIKTTITYPAIVDLSGGSINKEKLPDGWTKVTKANGDKYQKYFDKGTPAHRAAATDPAGVLDEWGTAIHKVSNTGKAFKAWVDNIPATGIAAKTTELVTWSTSSKNFNPDADDVDDGITISDKDKNPYDSEDYPIPMVDGEDFVIHVTPDPVTKTDEIVVVIGDDPATEVTPGEGGKVTIKDEDKAKEIKIKYKYVVTVDLNGASILPAGGNPPTGWTKSEATSSNQYTKKFLSGTSAETVENEWSRVNSTYVKYLNHARSSTPWITTIGPEEGKGKGLQADSKSTMQWLTEDQSVLLTITYDDDKSLIVKDTDGQNYSSAEFPLAVEKSKDFVFTTDVVEGQETEDADLRLIDNDGVGTQILPDAEGNYTIETVSTDPKIVAYFYYPVTVDFNGGTYSTTEELPNGWTLVPSLTEEKYYKYFPKHSPQSVAQDEWENFTEFIVAPVGKSFLEIELDADEVLKAEEFLIKWNDRLCTVKFTVNNSDYGTVNIGANGTQVPYNTEVNVNNNQISIGDTTVTASANSEDIQYYYTFDNWTVSTAYSYNYGWTDKVLNDDFEPITSDCTFKANFKQTTKKYDVIFDADTDGAVSPPSDWTKTEDNKYVKQFDYGTTKAKVVDDLKQFSITKKGHTLTEDYEANIEKVGLDGQNMEIKATYTTNKYNVSFEVDNSSTVEPDRGVLEIDSVSKDSFSIANVEYGTEYTIETASDNSKSKFSITVGEKDYEIYAKPKYKDSSDYCFTFSKWKANSGETLSGTIDEDTNFVAFFDYALKQFDVTIDFTDGEYEFEMSNIPTGWTKVEETQQSDNNWNIFADWFGGSNDVKSQKYTKKFNIKTSITEQIIPEWDNVIIDNDVSVRLYKGIDTSTLTTETLKKNTDISAIWVNAFCDISMDKGQGVDQVLDPAGHEIEDEFQVPYEGTVTLRVTTKDPNNEAIVYVNGKPISKNEEGYFVSDPVTRDSEFKVEVSYYVTVNLNGGYSTDVPDVYSYDHDNNVYKTYYPAGTKIQDISDAWNVNSISKPKSGDTKYKFDNWTIKDSQGQPVGENLDRSVVYTANFASSKELTLNKDASVTITDINNNELTTPVTVYDNAGFDFKVEDSEGGTIKVLYIKDGAESEISPVDDVYSLTNEQVKQEGEIKVKLYYNITVDLDGGTPKTTPENWTKNDDGTYWRQYEKGYLISDSLNEWNLVDDNVKKTGNHWSTWSNLEGNLSKHITCQIQWKLNTYKVVFNNQAGVSIDSDSPTMAAQTFEYNQTQALSDLAFVYTGHHFTKWYTDAECEGKTTFDNKEEVKDIVDVSTEDGKQIDLYAKWEANTYSVEFNANYEGASPASKPQSDFTYGEETKLNPLPGEWARKGYTFEGWATTATGSKVYDDEQGVTDVCKEDKGTQKLYAVWRAHTYTIRFNGNGSTKGSVETQTFTYDVEQKLTPNNYERTGYTWTKWTQVVSEGEPPTYGNEEKIKNLTDVDGEEITLNATWEANNYKIYVYPNHGEGAETATVVDVTYDAEYSLVSLEREGYDFRGFYKTSTGSDAFDASGTYTTAGDTTVYGCWQIKYYQLWFKSNNTNFGNVSIDSTSTCEGEETIPYGTPYTIDANNHLIVKDDNKTWIDVYITSKASTAQYSYVFDGWYLDEEKQTSGEIKDNYTFYAMFTQSTNQYTATLTKAEEETITWTGTGEHGWTETTTGFKKDFDYGTAYADILNGWEITSSYHTAKGSFEPGSGPLEADQEFTGNFEAGIRTATISTSLDGDMIVGSDSSPTTQTLTCNLSKTGDTPTYEWSSSQSDCLTFDDATSATPTITAVKDCEKAVNVSVTVTSTEGTYDPVTATKDIIVRNGTVSWSTDDELLDKVTLVKSSTEETTLTNGQRVAGGSTIKVYNKEKKYYDTFWGFSPTEQDYWNLQTETLGYGQDYNIYTSYYTGIVEWKMYRNFDKDDTTYTEQDQWLNWTYNGWNALSEWQKDKVGYTFEGCYTNQACTGKKLLNNNTVIDEDLADKLTGENGGAFCHWVANNYTIKFNSLGGSSQNDISAIYNQTYTAPTADQVKRTGYTFKGWAEKEGGEVVYNPGAELKNLAENKGDEVTLYAVWEANTYEVSFDGNGATGGTAMKPMSVTYGEKPVNLTKNTYERTGYTFAGWSTTTTGEVEYADEAEVSDLTEPLSLHAKWTPITYKITYISGDSTTTETKAYDDKVTSIKLTKNPYTKTNYAFTGWAAEEGGKVVYADEGDFTQPTKSGETKLWAVWANIPYTIRFWPNGASEGKMADQKVNLGDSFNLTKNEYEWDEQKSRQFIGWATSDASDADVKYMDNAAISENLGQGNDTVNLYAKWKEKDDRNLVVQHKVNGNWVNLLESGIQNLVISETESIKITYDGSDDGQTVNWSTKTETGQTGAVEITGSGTEVGIVGKTAGSGVTVTVSIGASSTYKSDGMTFNVVKVSKRDREFHWDLSDKSTTLGGSLYSVFYVNKAKDAEGKSIEPNITITQTPALFTKIEKGATDEHGTKISDAYTFTASADIGGTVNVNVTIPEDDQFEAVDLTYTPKIIKNSPTITVTKSIERLKKATGVTSTGEFTYEGDGIVSLSYIDPGSTEAKSSSSYISGTVNQSEGTFTLQGLKVGSVTVCLNATATDKCEAPATVSFEVIVNDGTRTLTYKDSENSDISTLYMQVGDSFNVKGVISDTLNADTYERTSASETIAKVAAVENKPTDINVTAVASGQTNITITVSDGKGYYGDVTATVKVVVLDFLYSVPTATTESNALDSIICIKYVASAKDILAIPTYVNLCSQTADGSTVKFTKYNVTQFGDGSNSVFDNNKYVKEFSFVAKDSSGYGGALTSISANACKNCTSIVRVKIPSTCTNVYSQAFYGCSALKYVVCEGGATNLGSQAFYGCSALTSYVVKTTTETYTYQSNTFPTDTKSYFILAGGSKTKAIATSLSRSYYTYYGVKDQTSVSELTSPVNGKYYYLEVGIDLTKGSIKVNSGVDCVFDLNGYNIKRTDVSSEAVSDGNVITTKSSRFRLDDSSSVIKDKVGKIWGGNNTSPGGGVVVSYENSSSPKSLTYSQCKFILANGKIAENNTTSSGGGVQIWAGEHSCVDRDKNKPQWGENVMVMLGGFICDNTATYNGGGVNTSGLGVNANFSSLLIMHGGLISGNECTNGKGGGVYLDANGQKDFWHNDYGDSSFGILLLNGGSITGNKYGSNSKTANDVYSRKHSNCNSDNNAFGRFRPNGGTASKVEYGAGSSSGDYAWNRWFRDNTSLNDKRRGFETTDWGYGKYLTGYYGY